MVVQSSVANIPFKNNRRKGDGGNIKTSVCWNTYFYTPNDAITQKYNQIVEYHENLPASMVDGLGNLEVVDQEPIKEIPLCRKLENCHIKQHQAKAIGI